MLGKVRNLSRVSGITTRQPRSAGQPGPIQRAPDATRLPLPIHWHASRGGPRGWRASIALSPTRSPSDDDDDGPSKPCPFPRGMRSTHAPSRPRPAGPRHSINRPPTLLRPQCTPAVHAQSAGRQGGGTRRRTGTCITARFALVLLPLRPLGLLHHHPLPVGYATSNSPSHRHQRLH